MKNIEQHNNEIQKNLEYWNKKPLLAKIYRGFHKSISYYLAKDLKGLTLELGSGIGNIKEVIPDCIRSDLFPNPWLDSVENAYELSFENNSISNLILFDVFHHLRYPGVALDEFNRVLVPNGRVIIFEPCVSLLGLIVYGLLHHEPLAIKEKIEWKPNKEWSPKDIDYYAAQGNATRIFMSNNFTDSLKDWKIVTKRRFSAISYVASGGYSKPQMYPDFALPIVQIIDKICDFFPWIFSTRLLIVLEKK